MDFIKKNSFHLWFWPAVFFLFFFRTAHVPLWSSDEGRYGEIAREMWLTKDFVVPHFNFMDYLEKPILAPFLTALSFGLFGVSSLSTRLPSIASAIGGILLCYGFIKRLLNKEVAQMAAIVLATSLGQVMVGRFAVIDMLMSFLLAASLICLLTACLEKKKHFYLAAYALMGLGFLTKGLIAFMLPALIFGSFLLWTRNLGEIRNMQLGKGILIAAAVIAPWLIAVSIREPQFLKIFIINQQFARFTGTLQFGRSRPFWFFFAIFPLVIVPWTLFLPAALARAFKLPESREKAVLRFMMCWIAAVIVFFSIPKPKLPYYMLPTVMPAAILIASVFPAQIQSAGRALLDKITWRLIYSLFTLGSVAWLVTLYFSDRTPLLSLIRPLLVLGFPLCLAGGLAIRTFFEKGNVRAAVFAFAGVIYGLLLFAAVGMEKLSPYQSTSEFVEVMNPVLKDGDIVAIYASPDRFSDLPFHLRRRIVIVGGDRGTLAPDSLKSEHAEEVRQWFWGEEELASRFKARQGRIFCLMENERLPALKEKGLTDYKVLLESHERILISNE